MLAVYIVMILKHFALPSPPQPPMVLKYSTPGIFQVFMYSFLCQTVLILPIYIYRLFGLELSLVYGVLAHFESKIYKDYKQYQIFIYSFLFLTVLMFWIHTLFTKTIETFWSRTLDKSSKHFWVTTKSSCAKMSQYSHIIYYWRTGKVFSTIVSKTWFYFFFLIIFFIYPSNHQIQNFLNKSFASDLLMSWITQL